MSSILRKFLDGGMLDIGDDDTRYEALLKTSEELTKILSENREAVINYTLVALDPDIPPDEPLLDQVEDLFKEYWTTLRNRFPDRPCQLLRAIILESLNRVGSENPEIGAIIWLTGSSLLPYLKLDREGDIYSEFILEMGSLVEKAAVEEWANTQLPDVPKLRLRKIKFSELEIPSINLDILTQHLEAASGPQTQGNAPISQDLDPNPQWPNSGQPWAYKFAPRAAEGIAEVVDASNNALFSHLSNNVDQLNTEIEKYFAYVQSKTTEIIKNATKSSIATTRKTNLLWWKEVLYSPTLRQSYRVLQPAVAILAMAFDLCEQVPLIYPASVDFLLRETVRDLIALSENESNKTTFRDFFNEILSAENQELLKTFIHVNETATEVGRVPFATFVRAVLYDKSELNNDIPHRIGVAGEQEISYEELSVWYFHDLQAQELAFGKEE